MAAWTTRQQRGLGIYYAVVAVIIWIIALVQAPVADWGTWGVLLGAALAVLGIMGVYMALTGKGNTRSRTMSEKTQRIWAIVGVVAMTVAVIGTLVSNLGDWTVVATMSIGIWIALAGLFLSQLATLGRD